MVDREELLYLDSSALVKLILPEPESETLIEFLSEFPGLISSEIARVEVVRATRRVSRASNVMKRAERVLESVHLLRVDPKIVLTASQLNPPSLRTVDAIHLASALELPSDLTSFVAYDKALQSAAAAYGLRLKTP